MDFGVKFGLEVGEISAAEELFGLDGGDKPLSVEEEDVLFSDEAFIDDVDDFVLVGILEAVGAEMDIDVGARISVPPDAAAVGVEVIEGPCVEEVDVVAPVHARSGPHGEPVEPEIPSFDIEVSHGDARIPFTVVMEELVAVDGKGGDDIDDGAVVGFVGGVFEVEFDVASFVDPWGRGDDTGLPSCFHAVRVHGRLHAPIRPELEPVGEILGHGSLLLGLQFLNFGIGPDLILSEVVDLTLQIINA